MGKVSMLLSYINFKGAKYTYLEISSSNKEDLLYTFPFLRSRYILSRNNYKNLFDKTYVLKFFEGIQLEKDVRLASLSEVFLYFVTEGYICKKLSNRKIINILNREKKLIYTDSRLDIVNRNNSICCRKEYLPEVSLFELLKNLKVVDREFCCKSPEFVENLLYRNYLIDKGIINEPRII